MATAAALPTTDESETCTLCSSKHNRTRPSFCQCKHCSIPLCLDCMKEHHDEVLQNVAQLSHQYNELQELMQTKQKIIVEETTKSVEDVNRYFETYLNELHETYRKIIADIEKAEQDAQDYVLKMDSDLHTLGIDIQALAKESIVQPTKMKSLSIELKRIEQEVNMYHATRTENLITTKPEFSLKFDCSAVVIGQTSQPHDNDAKQLLKTDVEEPSSGISSLNTLPQLSPKESLLCQPDKVDRFQNGGTRCLISNDDRSKVRNHYFPTTYSIDRMASDGQNIFYTSYDEDGLDLIAYCYMDDDDNSADEYRVWKWSRIKDIIWWNSIDKFICATNDAIYTIDYANRKFKSLCVLRGNWSYISVAANTDHLFTWINPVGTDFNGIMVYSIQFEHIKTIDFDALQSGYFVDESSSFCVTDNLIASICIRMQSNREVFQVNFCDFKMHKLNTILLGECYDNNMEIRTDGKDGFFITTGGRRFYIVNSNGKKQTVTLQKDGGCIAVLNNRRIAVSNGGTDVELVTC